MTVESEVANLTTAVDNLTSSVNVKKATLDASVADAQGAQTGAQDARDTANLHKLAAEAAATSATNTAAALTGFDLDAIAETKGVTAVDVFVYDTSKDSDGGAWRKRTQHTSWYNETLNTATRGSRREFPAVAVIVAESNKVTIYDGDDPSLPMWMVFLGNSDGANVNFIGGVNDGVSSIAFLNGKMGVTRTASFPGFYTVDFLSEENIRYHPTQNELLWVGVSDRNEKHSYLGIGPAPAIVDDVVNDVAMTVLPDAPIDPATGLPVPTIAVATDGGVSVIKDDGTVVDLTYAYSGDNKAYDVSLNTTGRLSWGSRGISSTGTYFLVENSIPMSDKSTAPDAIYTSKNILGGALRFNEITSPYITASIGDVLGHGAGGITHLAENPTTPAKGMVAYTTSTYNTGWMNGDIKGAFLSDTDDTDLVGSGELVTNGTFDTDISGWTDASEAGGSIAWNASGYLDLTTGSTNANEGKAQQTVSTVVGKQYAVTFDVKSGGGLVVNASATYAVGDGHVYYFTAVSSTLDITFRNFGNTSGTTSIDNISVKLADADRSVNNNGLTVNGTVTRSPVATGADLVAYSGFSASNYLEQPYNSDLDFGTGDFCVMGWVNPTTTTNCWFWSRGDGSSAGSTMMYLNSSGYLGFGIYTTSWQTTVSTTTPPINSPSFVAAVRVSGVIYLYVNGSLVHSGSNANTVDNSGSLIFGKRQDASNFTLGSLALWRISATAPTAEAIKKIYNDEKVLFQENAACTLYGSSDAVTALAHDDATDLLHVGTSAGRSVFQGLRRVSNTTVAVGTAISASNGLVVEE